MFTLTDSPIDANALARQLEDPGSGALVTFEGRVRNHNKERPVLRLRYEAYTELVVRTGEQILEEARERFDLTGAAASHRIGVLAIGDVAVWVGTCAAHRSAAFDACRYIIDTLKERLPIWKQEEYAEGEERWL